MNNLLIRHLFPLFVFIALLLISGCENRDEKIASIERTRRVEYFGKIYSIAKVDRKADAVFIIEPDGVQVPVPIDNVKLVTH